MTDLDLMRDMTDSQRFLFQTEMLKHRKSVGVAAVLCFAGFFGLHRFYLGQIGLGLLYACTLGLLFVGALLDLLRIGSIVERVNRAKAEEVAAQIRALDAPPSQDSGPPSLARRLGRRVGGGLVVIATVLLAAVEASADVVELKTGQRIEGALKQATPASVSVEVGGQTITFDREKVRAIYFGAAPAPIEVSPPPPAREAMDALRGLQSVVQAGVSYRDYSSRALDAKVKVDGYLRSAGTTAEKAPIGDAMRMYTMAATAWSGRITDGRLDLRTDPVIIPCLLEKGEMRQSEATDPGPLAFATKEALYRAQQAFWSCASDKLAEAEKLLSGLK